MTSNFYDKVAKKFGGYAFGKGHVKHLTEYPDGDPEKIFKKKLLGLANKNKIALDAGCGDGKFAFQIAKYFLSITGIDTSKELLKIAGHKRSVLRVKNVIFKLQNAAKTSFPAKSFDVIYSRRGPTPFAEFHRLLKSGGYFIGIDIGEKDCQGIKEIFGRGQDFGQWNTSRLVKDKQELKRVGFEIVFSQDYIYDEYYASHDDLDLFLQGVPIFEDFDSEKDKQSLREYVVNFQTEKGIRFPRHRVVIAAEKP
ncbi:class I SAM-dependent methyltransferase [Candidatus Collierbacteria bacterium]|nr:class I SAM-dependent methyltransferase [Candidatus Collierbacteria bacterium]